VLAAAAGFFPLDEQLRLWDQHWSEGVVREALWVSGIAHSYRDAQEALERLSRIHVSRSSLWERVQHWGQRFGEVAEAERAQALALPEQWQPPSRAEVADQRMGVALDGFMVHLRAEGWKEMKVGALFDIAVQPTPDPDLGELVPVAHAVNVSYVAHLGGPEVLGAMAYAEARRRGWERAQDTEALGDGAVWIWHQVALHFPDSRQAVDWYHAKEHLAEAAKLLHGEGTPASERWLKSRETTLYQGHAARITCELEQAAAQKAGEVAAALKREAGYFWEHQHRMNYLELREEEWPIGSGMVESGGNLFQARLCGAGMRWSRDGIQNLTPVRAAILSRRFDEVWDRAYSPPPK
jgi:hypothetical protein